MIARLALVIQTGIHLTVLMLHLPGELGTLLRPIRCGVGHARAGDSCTQRQQAYQEGKQDWQKLVHTRLHKENILIGSRLVHVGQANMGKVPPSTRFLRHLKGLRFSMQEKSYALNLNIGPIIRTFFDQ